MSATNHRLRVWFGAARRFGEQQLGKRGNAVRPGDFDRIPDHRGIHHMVSDCQRASSRARRPGCFVCVCPFQLIYQVYSSSIIIIVLISSSAVVEKVNRFLQRFSVSRRALRQEDEEGRSTHSSSHALKSKQVGRARSVCGTYHTPCATPAFPGN